ncbi:hypothetical protein VTL71DRAFT_509 [Oculimacula yallundae]|uniref:2EXR domain-containing protein n=1 Tax=Oculimacula yallundae TaxID=86028 RepID=A0ABR4D0B0_9HELO
MERPISSVPTQKQSLADGPNPENKTLTKFTLFPKLCSELQLKIWAHAYADLEERLLSIEPPLVQVPPLLQTCLDSRNLGLRIYHRKEHVAKPGVPSFISIINFKKDILNLNVRGPYPKPDGEVEMFYIRKKSPGHRSRMFSSKDSLLRYTVVTYPELCSQFKYITLRTLYLEYLNRRGWSKNIRGIFKKNFPLLETIGTVVSAVEAPESVQMRCSWWMREDLWLQLPKMGDGDYEGLRELFRPMSL